MTVSVTSPINTYTGAGNANTFSFSFPIFTSDQIKVTVKNTTTLVVTTLTLGTDYSVSGLNVTAGPASPGSITLISAGQAWLTGVNLATGYTLTIQANFPLSQATSIRDQGDFLRASLENALDNLEYQIQQLNLLTLTLNGGGTVTFISNLANFVGVSSTPVSMISGNTYLVHTAGGAYQLNLPTPAPGAWFFIKDADQNAWTNNITIHRAAAEKIDGIAADLVLPANNGCWLIATDGVNWYSLATAGDLVLNDISNGHTYRQLSKNGVLSSQQVN